VGLLSMSRFLGPILLTTALLALPALAQTPPTQGRPQSGSPAAPAPTPSPAQPATPPPGGSAAQAPKTTSPAPGGPAAGAPASPGAIPLFAWFKEIDTANKGEVTREQFLKYRMKTFDQLDANHDGKVTLEEFLKVAEPPYTPEGPNLPPLEERRALATAEFQNLDTNRDGVVDRSEAEARIHADFNRYDTDRDNKITEPELRLIVQEAMRREQEQRAQAEAQRRRGMVGINEFIEMQLRVADQLDKNGDGRITQQEWLIAAGPADGPQAQGLLPYDLRKKIALIKFGEMDTNKDGVLDRVEMTAHAVKQFLEIDLNKDRFLNEEEFKKSQEVEQQKMRAMVQAMQPAPRPAPAPAPAQAKPAAPAAPPGLAPGLPQGTR
jgi:Ca2+-binding EF-hand superfamily protein